MIIINAMIISPRFRIQAKKQSGFTLLEMVMAFTLFSIVFLSIFGLVGNLQLRQSKIQVANNFYDESRVLMDRVVQKIRNNTIDYDRYYCVENSLKLTQSEKEDDCNNLNSPEKIYKNEFYKDIGDKKRQLGGIDGNFDQPDNATRAFINSIGHENLYLINADKTIRTALRINGTTNLLELQTQIGADANNDGIIDEWSDSPDWDKVDGRCRISEVLIKGDSTREDFCNKAHIFTSIAPEQITVISSSFDLYPNKDPYLAFADNKVQAQPLVRLNITMKMDKPEGYGFEENEIPTIDFQTSASSRIFGTK